MSFPTHHAYLEAVTPEVPGRPFMTYPQIRPALSTDDPAISALALAAFGQAEGPEIAQLIADLAADLTARPLLSLVASVDGAVIGHVMFSKAGLEPAQPRVTAALLAPLAVHPDFQKRGIGGRLVQEGLRQLAEAAVDLVFVLGHPGYYPRFGFSPAGRLGLSATHPIAEKNAAAWMVRELRPGSLGHVQGRVRCADALADPKYWIE